jgi:hypothetical protein
MLWPSLALLSAEGKKAEPDGYMRNKNMRNLGSSKFDGGDSSGRSNSFPILCPLPHGWLTSHRVACLPTSWAVIELLLSTGYVILFVRAATVWDEINRSTDMKSTAYNDISVA